MASSEWKDIPFEEIVDFQEGPGIMARDFRDEGVPLIRLSGLDSGASVLDGCNFLDPDMVVKRWNHFRVAPGDTLLSTSASLGHIAVVDSQGEGAIPYTGIIRMRPRDKRLASAFIRFILASSHFQQQAEAAGSGSVIRHFGPTHLRHMTLRLPPPVIQQAIVEILSVLEDKLALNRRMNETLEKMAQALFKSWFVDFDPVRSKMAGREPSSMNAATAALFPADMHDSPLGVLPTGWRAGTLEELQSDQRNAITAGPFGSKLGRADYVEAGVPVIRGCNLGGAPGEWFSEDAFVYVSPEKTDRDLASCVARRGDVLFTQRGTLGQVGMIPFDACQERYVVSQSQMKMTCAPSVPPEYVVLTFKQPATLAYIEANAVSAGVPHVNLGFLRRFTILLPSMEVLGAFGDLVRPIQLRMRATVLENRLLARLRDSLLPELLSGQLHIRDAERAAEAVA